MAEILQFFYVFDLDGVLECVGKVGNSVVDGGWQAFGSGWRGCGFCSFISVGQRHVQVADVWCRSSAGRASQL